MALNEKNTNNNTSKFNENFIKNHDEESHKGYILEPDLEYPERLQNFHNDLPFLPERMRIKKCNKLYAVCMIKTSMLHT